jgi:hypothetical protein
MSSELRRNARDVLIVWLQERQKRGERRRARHVADCQSLAKIGVEQRGVRWMTCERIAKDGSAFVAIPQRL